MQREIRGFEYLHSSAVPTRVCWYFPAGSQTDTLPLMVLNVSDS